jgi:phosphoglucomutase
MLRSVQDLEGYAIRATDGAIGHYKIYAESFRGANHLGRILAEAQTIVDAALTAPAQQAMNASMSIASPKV